MDYSAERDDFCNSADSRETSHEIMEAIAAIAHNVEQAERIWAEPDRHEIEAICQKLANPPSSYCWGAAGSDWL